MFFKCLLFFIMNLHYNILPFKRVKTLHCHLGGKLHIFSPTRLTLKGREGRKEKDDMGRDGMGWDGMGKGR